LQSSATDSYNAVITWVDDLIEAKPGPLSGKTLLVKDLIDTAGIRTTYGSKIYADHVPERTAPAVQRLVDAGAVILGKGNLHEFAWGVTSQNPWYGTVKNPLHLGRTTGGSSGGNAAALAAGLCDLGLGTDTGCSIRLPSACCGTVGLKPRWGEISLEGIFPLSARRRPCRRAGVGARLAAFELRRAFLSESFHSFVEGVRRPQQPVGEPFDLQPEPERPVVGVVQHALRHRECER
jgi:Asp-tRNA(Asn)/Glu-tRNA(Gln) amidotransferase A subunit family amidase